MAPRDHEIADQRGTEVRAVEHLVKSSFSAAEVSAGAAGNGRTVAVRSFTSDAGMPRGR
jgi:hypothetical protein